MSLKLRIKTIKRPRTMIIFVNGREVEAYPGETVQSALVAAGYRSLRHAQGDRDPRGGFCGMGLCYECLVTIDGAPNRRACMTEVQNKMEVWVHVE